MNGKNLAVALLAHLEREGSASVPQMAELLGVEEELVWNTLEMLVFAYDSVDVRLDLDESHASLRRFGRNRLLRLNASETNVLVDALLSYGLEPESELVRKLEQAKGLLSGDEGEVGRMRTMDRGVDAGIAERLAFACEDEAHHVLEIEYHKDGTAAPALRRVEPHLIRSDGDRSMLEAYDQQKQGWRSFRIDRIKSVRTLGQTFEPKPYEHGSAGSTAKLRFARDAFPTDWPGLKRTRTLEDGSTEATIPWYGSMWLPKHVVALLGDAEPLSPPELRARCAEYAEQLLV